MVGSFLTMTDISSSVLSKPRAWKIPENFLPKTIVCLREGYGRAFFWTDLTAGLTVAIIALPLSLALAIGSGVRPEQGLFTAIVAGFLISLLGGSRVQIGGPAAAFMAIVAGIVARDGYEGLCIAGLMAGVILIIMGLAGLGSLIKFIPYPVTTGFTSGIAVVIFTSQIRDLLGLTVSYANDRGGIVHGLPPGFLADWRVLIESVHTINWLAAGFGIGALALLIVLRRFVPRLPGAIIVVILSSVLVSIFHLAAAPGVGGIETLGTRFGGIPSSLPSPHMPVKLSSWHDISAAWNRAYTLIPEATTIALLCAIESLLCAVVADGMIGGRHKSNCELVAQGIANIGSIIFGGIPATGVIARTAANVKSGGRTPLAGMVHSATLLVLMLLLAPYASRIPLAVLAAILVMVAWNMAEIDHFKSIFRAPRADRIVLLTTFGLTVLTDLTKGVGVGMVLAALLFMKRMTEVTGVGSMLRAEVEESGDEFADLSDPNSMNRRQTPPGVEVYEINGPFFFGVADRLKDTLKSLERPPKVFILRMRRVPAIDATGMHALDEFYDKCRKQGTRLLLSGVHSQPIFAMTQYGLIDKIGLDNMYGNIDDALNHARHIVGQPLQPRPTGAVAEVKREDR
jgi:sulfate permease, SulP family